MNPLVYAFEEFYRIPKIQLQYTACIPQTYYTAKIVRGQLMAPSHPEDYGQEADFYGGIQYKHWSATLSSSLEAGKATAGGKLGKTGFKPGSTGRG
jgi:hypothetical protein